LHLRVTSRFFLRFQILATSQIFFSAGLDIFFSGFVSASFLTQASLVGVSEVPLGEVAGARDRKARLTFLLLCG